MITRYTYVYIELRYNNVNSFSKEINSKGFQSDFNSSSQKYKEI